MYYKIYKGFDSLNVILLDSTTSTTYKDTKVSIGASYFYWVSAVDRTGFEGEKSGIHVPRPLEYALNIPKAGHPPVIDGHMDAIWSYVPLNEDFKNINGFTPIESSADCSPSFRVMWDNNYLYYYCHVIDDHLVNDDGGSYTDDSFEIYSDGMYSHGTSYDGVDDAQFRFPWNQNAVFNSGLDVSGFQFAQIDTLGGWSLEVAMPLTALNIPPTVGHVLGLDVQYEDDDNGGDRDHKMGWWQTTDESWHNPSVFGKAQLTDQVISDQLPPVIIGITAPIEPVQVNTQIQANASFTDQSGTHTAIWYWEADNTSIGIVSENNGSGTVSGSHAYKTAGVYTVRLVVTDDNQRSAEAVFQYVVVFDPNAGFVTGGGWINSPQGAYMADPTLTGKVNFEFVSKYKKGSKNKKDSFVLTGDTEFQFKAAHLNFKSTGYEWLVIADEKAEYKGSGTINGTGNYGFMVTATDGKRKKGNDPDKFRIKIWSKDAGAGVVYDNQMGAADDAEATMAIAGGSIKVHNQGLAKGADGEWIDASAELPEEFALDQNYPNPFNPKTEIRFALPKDRSVTLKIYNLFGQEIQTLADGDFKAGYHTVVWDGRDQRGNPVSSGIYLYRIQAGEFNVVKKMSLLR
jgi:PKD repeat protein